MLTANLGSLPVSITLLLLIAALFVAAGVGLLAGRGGNTGIGNVLINMLLAAVVVARIAFVAVHFDSYRDSPWSMLDIRDGGFLPWLGIAAALLLALWHGWRRAPLRKPLAMGLAAGVFALGAMFGAIRLMTNHTGLPKTPLTTLAGAPADLASLAAGKPLVINLWATWCPPCRREMPLLAAAQKRESRLRFVFVDQGESAAAAKRYLAAAGLDISNVLLDIGAGIPQEVGSQGLPTTLFYDAKGRLVDSHVGELSAASLARRLNELRGPLSRSNGRPQ
ncbi:MAG TPA: TlpA disulfide reductase family protein [Burkholderiales bacterium]|nr:TlpA disulfide reductase family protein [Burkholderiales bacterium]